MLGPTHDFHDCPSIHVAMLNALLFCETNLPSEIALSHWQEQQDPSLKFYSTLLSIRSTLPYPLAPWLFPLCFEVMRAGLYSLMSASRQFSWAKNVKWMRVRGAQVPKVFGVIWSSLVTTHCFGKRFLHWNSSGGHGVVDIVPKLSK